MVLLAICYPTVSTNWQVHAHSFLFTFVIVSFLFPFFLDGNQDDKMRTRDEFCILTPSLQKIGM